MGVSTMSHPIDLIHYKVLRLETQMQASKPGENNLERVPHLSY